MVRLRVQITYKGKRKFSKFQFHYGAIKGDDIGLETAAKF